MDTIRTQYGTFAIDRGRDKKMAEALDDDVYPNEDLLKVARQFVNKKSTVLDIGAHIGTFAIPIAAEVEKVIAFEPSPESFALLQRNAKENNVPVQPLNKALGSEKRSGTLVTRNVANAGSNTLVAGDDVVVSTLDSEVADADFIKIDVEGMELEVLHGGTRLIEQFRPVLLFEANLSQLRAHGTSPRALEQFFAKHGYQLYFALEEEHWMLARVRSATLLTALIAPRAWLFWGDSAPFDLIAVPKELPIQSVGFLSAIRYALRNNLANKGERFAAFFRGIL